MNNDEKAVNKFLKSIYGENVIFEPIPNSTPDFVINENIAIEVRRLNQNFKYKDNTEGLENLAFPLFAIFRNVLSSFDSFYKEKSYWVSIHYRRPIIINRQNIEKKMKIALQNFLSLHEPNLPFEIFVTENIYFSLAFSEPVSGRTFRPSGSLDFDAGGWLIPVYSENIKNCISEKSKKIQKNLNLFNHWWLLLVDHIGWGLDHNEIEEVFKLVGNTDYFEKVIIIDSNGENLLTSFQSNIAIS